MNEHDDTQDISRGFLERDAQDRKALSWLLERYATARNKLFVQRGMMGGTESFVGSVPLEWFAERVRFASQLPLFRNKLDKETNKIIVDKETIDDIVQRPLDWSRQSALAQYLAARPRHKFPPVLVVVSQGWADDPEADEWGADGRAVRSTSEFTPLDQSGSLGLLDISDDMQIFALDGQHRLMGVKGLMELIQSGKLPIKDKNGAQKKDQFVSVEHLEEEFGISQSQLQALSKERIGIEFITAVLAGETRDEAKKRVRSIFVHVNRMAAKLTDGQIKQLEEDDGFALIGKSVAVDHKFLASDGRVNMENNTIGIRSASFTTLATLTEMAREFLRSKYPKWDLSERGLIPMRPEDDELSQAEGDFRKLIDLIVNLPSVQRVAKGTPTARLRNFTSKVLDKEKDIKGEGHILFRPVGQQALASALGDLVYGQSPGKNLDSMATKLAKFDKDGGFSTIDRPGSIWYGVLYDPNGRRMRVAGKDLATDLLKYLLNQGLDDEDRENLRKQFAEARTVEDSAINFDGKRVDPKDIELPKPIA